MLQGFGAELRRLGLYGAVCVIIGLIIGHLGYTLVAGMVFYLCWMLWQMRRLNQWLLRKHDEDPPEASGLWGEVFDNVYGLQRLQRYEKQNLEAVISRVQESTSALRDGVIVLDRRGYLDWWNPAAQRLLGFKVSDRNQPILNFIRHPRFVEYFEGGDYSDPLDLPSPRFNAKQLQFHITYFGRSERLVLVRDVTRLYNLEQMRQNFIANVSHELRTPLTVLKGYLETLDDSRALGAEWDKPMQQMLQQAQRMNLLVNDLTTLSKLETTEVGLNQQKVALGPLIERIRNEALVLAGDKQQRISCECMPDITLMGSEKELHSAFSNLVVNAIKYTQAEGEIRLKLWRERDRVCFSVTDNGPGFERKHIPQLTQRFYRIESSRNSGTGGTGLGLAIVKHVLLRHDAELQIDSEVGKGSTFTCVFTPPESVDSAKN
ncbi:phosphate regulon sensor histidine kinase PhoR [Marinimicrobium alkaliphilum]|uniref:phosphate regulon sensor histidine kinase PhoR n=1 Tax=Marinimicrobium alkaliphilum TaxID=2202654 RepID=UPI000DBAB4F9|nr:phosphate regulon sensor histidine kinase PhoR [Marinimicrobium alkaliphilum]